MLWATIWYYKHEIYPNTPYSWEYQTTEHFREESDNERMNKSGHMNDTFCYSTWSPL